MSYKLKNNNNDKQDIKTMIWDIEILEFLSKS